jgi:hypothetical protein
LDFALPSGTAPPPDEAAETIGVAFLTNGGPATVYGARLHAAIVEFWPGSAIGRDQPFSRQP